MWICHDESDDLHGSRGNDGLLFQQNQMLERRETAVGSGTPSRWSWSMRSIELCADADADAHDYAKEAAQNVSFEGICLRARQSQGDDVRAQG